MSGEKKDLKIKLKDDKGKYYEIISTEQFNIQEELNKEIEINIKYKEVLDKIKEYCNHKLEMLELQKRNIMQILTPENGYLKTDIEIEMQKYKDILELLEEIE